MTAFKQNTTYTAQRVIKNICMYEASASQCEYIICEYKNIAENKRIVTKSKKDKTMFRSTYFEFDRDDVNNKPVRYVDRVNSTQRKRNKFE